MCENLSLILRHQVGRFLVEVSAKGRDGEVLCKAEAPECIEAGVASETAAVYDDPLDLVMTITSPLDVCIVDSIYLLICSTIWLCCLYTSSWVYIEK